MNIRVATFAETLRPTWCRTRSTTTMKTLLSLGLAWLAVAPVSAQILRPATVNGAVLGGIAGAVIGNNSGSLNHNAWKGAAIGAGVGALVGSAVARDHDRRDVRVRAPHHPSPYVYRHAPVVYRGYDRGGYYGGGYYSGGGYYGGSHARDGIFLGALAGGIIGHNSGSFRHNGWHGAAWGAGAGWLLGSIADANRRAVIWERPPVYVEQAQPVYVQTPVQPAQPAAQPQQITIINNYYGNATPMSQANGLFGR
jgi:uncharacterized protein YcfJ